MQNPKKQKQKAQPGLWPTEQEVNGLEKSILYIQPDKTYMREQVSRFLDYLELAKSPNAIAVLIKMYFSYSTTPGVPKLFTTEELDEFALLASLMADLSVIEGEHISEEREMILEGLYYDAKWGEVNHGKE